MASELYGLIATIVIFVFSLYCIVSYCIVFSRIVLYFILSHCILFYFIVMYSIVFYCILFYRIVFYRNVMYCIVLYCIPLYCAVRPPTNNFPTFFWLTLAHGSLVSFTFINILFQSFSLHCFSSLFHFSSFSSSQSSFHTCFLHPLHSSSNNLVNKLFKQPFWNNLLMSRTHCTNHNEFFVDFFLLVRTQKIFI